MDFCNDCKADQKSGKTLVRAAGIDQNKFPAEFWLCKDCLAKRK